MEFKFTLFVSISLYSHWCLFAKTNLLLVWSINLILLKDNPGLVKVTYSAIDGLM